MIPCISNIVDKDVRLKNWIFLSIFFFIIIINRDIESDSKDVNKQNA
jgi:hypothetical protein